ncbi:PLC-like phosphodiesterase [Xylogone sp. PMI_703]|nr:PLC-like phosphodiesterase [Xylogone sp. PMI_703]
MRNIHSAVDQIALAGFLLATMVCLLMSLALVASTFTTAIQASPASSGHPSKPSLADLALQKVLDDASSIFGVYENVQSHTATWMKKYPDRTELYRMNIPGTHDSATWNYTQARQDELRPLTDINGVVPAPAQYYRCQDVPFIDMLNGGIRAFDLRFAFDPTNTTLVFYHSQSLQSETSTVNDVLYAFYHWLDDHPSETIFLSFMNEGSTAKYAHFDVRVQTAIYNALTDAAAKKYFVQTKGELVTLGEARGKITLLRRFNLNQLPASYNAALPGLDFTNGWNDNDPDITLQYNGAKGLNAYIEDFYEMDSPIGSPASLNVAWKYNTTTAHLIKAATEHHDSLFWSFASSEYTSNIPPETPEIQALGNGTAVTPLGGVNDRLVSFLRGMKGKRVGIVMFDFFEQPSNLIETFLSI